MKTITDWIVCGSRGKHWLTGQDGRGRHIMTGWITGVTGRFKCTTQNSTYLLVGPCIRLDVQKLRGDDPMNPLAFLKPFLEGADDDQRE